ncbi:shematrin-like protein 2 [Paramacrobiotus metropolitanus]|uniref:shematrin-like protein 2 n=1 Tax=Paramacrobiotus metropolitanus TaxID=2943436 RepID=UPI002445ECCE|nr:shematrin-like protein 2 [Paramacrobiotus metropolitanus]
MHTRWTGCGSRSFAYAVLSGVAVLLVALVSRHTVSGQYGGYAGGYGGGYGYASPYYFVAPYGYNVSTNPSYLLGYVLQVQSLPTYVNNATYGYGYLPTFYQGYYPGALPPNYGYPNGPPGYGGGYPGGFPGGYGGYGGGFPGGFPG